MNSRPILKTLSVLLLALPAGPANASLQGAEGLAAATGGSLFYRSMGSGPPVLLLHGYSLASSVWTPYLTELANRHHVVAFDLPGHGRSDRLRPTFSHRTAAASLLEAADSLGISTFHVVGHSSGGLIALHMALLQPERVLSIVTIATPWRAPDSLRHQGSQVPPDTEALLHWHPGGTEQVDWLVQQQRRIAADPREMALSDEQLRQIEAPTLVVHGDRDTLLPVDSAVGLATRLPHASLLVLPGGTHALIMDSGAASRLFALALSDFLSGRASNAASERALSAAAPIAEVPIVGTYSDAQLASITSFTLPRTLLYSAAGELVPQEEWPAELAGLKQHAGEAFCCVSDTPPPPGSTGPPADCEVIVYGTDVHENFEGLTDGSGRAITYQELPRHRYLLVEYFATWCLPCIAGREAIEAFFATAPEAAGYLWLTIDVSRLPDAHEAARQLQGGADQ